MEQQKITEFNSLNEIIVQIYERNYENNGREKC